MSIKITNDQCLFKENSLLITFNLFGNDNVVEIDYDVENFKMEINSNLAKMSNEYEFIINNFKKILDSNNNQIYIKYDDNIKRIKFVDRLGIDRHFRALYKKVMLEFNVYIDQEGIIIINLEPSRYCYIIAELANKIKEMDGLVSDKDYIKQLTNLLTVTNINVLEEE